MVQLILDVGGTYEFTLPESIKENYTAVKIPLATTAQMISGRTVRELRGNVWQVSYQYGYFKQTDLTNLLGACEKGMSQPIVCSFLTQENPEELTTEEFWVDSYQRPKFMWSLEGEPLWADFSIVLRGVRPSD